jgi:hypothetical protein
MLSNAVQAANDPDAAVALWTSQSSVPYTSFNIEAARMPDVPQSEQGTERKPESR